MKNKTIDILHTALLHDGEMSYALYEYEMEEHIDYWKKELKKDKDEFVFVIDERDGDVAMLLITKKHELYINEKAREQLKIIWKNVYQKNIELLLPDMAEQLANGILSVNGVKYSKTNSKHPPFGEAGMG
ncbi:MAG TPA: hypothetical protein VNG53_08960 [Bacteroidia bacterium]|nr:hypothetical protein [Bacteroidia bacterium]